MNRLGALAGVLILLLGFLGAAWRSGYFEEKKSKTIRIGEFVLEPDQPWEVLLKKELDQAEAVVDVSLRAAAPVEFRDLQFPTGDLIRLQRDASRRLQKYLLNVETEAYKKRTKDPQAAQEKAIQFLEASIEVKVGIKGNWDFRKANELGEASLKAGCEDKAIKFLLVDQTEEGWKDNIQAAIDNLLAAKPSRYMQIEAYDAQFRLWRLNRKIVGGIDPMAQLQDGLIAWAKESGDAPLAQVYIYGMSRKLHTGEVEGNHANVHRAFAQASNIPPWLRHMIAGSFHNNVAWTSRGTDWTLDPERGHLFASELKIAARHLAYAWHLMPDYPHAASLMISVSLGGVDSKYGSPTTWFQRTMNARFDFEEAFTRYSNALMPRWGGSIEEQIQFSRLCIETKRFDTFVPGLATRQLFAIQQNEYGQTRKVMSRGDALQLVRQYEDAYALAMKERPADAQGPAFRPFPSISAAALYAQAGKYADARRVLQGKENPIPGLRSELTALWEPASLLASAIFTEQEDEALVKSMLTKLVEGFGFNRPAEELNALLKSLESRLEACKDPKGKPFFQHSIAVVKRALSFQMGDWVPLTFENEGAGWTVSAPEWKFVDDKTLWMSNVAGNGKRVMQADLLNQVPFPFVMEFDMTPKVTSGAIGMVGVVVGTRDVDAAQSQQLYSRFFGLDENYKSVMVISNHEAGVSLGANHQETTPYRVSVKCWPQWYTVAVNGFNYLNETDPGFQPAPRVGVGSGQVHRNLNEKGEVTFSNLRIRKLPYGEPPVNVLGDNLDGIVQSQEEYYRKELQFNPDDAWAKFGLGRALYLLSRREEALPLLLAAEKTSPTFRQMQIGPMIAGAYRMNREYELATRYFRDHFNSYKENADFVTDFAFLLASCPDEKYRNGKEALSLLEPLCKAKDAHWGCDFAKAAAHAELGEFEAALAVLDLAAQKARQKEKEVPKMIESCRAWYKDKRPYRFGDELND